MCLSVALWQVQTGDFCGESRGAGSNRTPFSLCEPQKVKVDSMVVNGCNLNTKVVGVGGSQVWDHSGLCSESQTKGTERGGEAESGRGGRREEGGRKGESEGGRERGRERSRWVRGIQTISQCHVTGTIARQDILRLKPASSLLSCRPQPDGCLVWIMREERAFCTQEVTPEHAPDDPTTRNDAANLHVLVHPAVWSCGPAPLHQPTGPYRAQPPASSR